MYPPFVVMESQVNTRASVINNHNAIVVSPKNYAILVTRKEGLENKVLLYSIR